VIAYIYLFVSSGNCRRIAVNLSVPEISLQKGMVHICQLKGQSVRLMDIRDAEISLKEYCPDGYAPELITEWPTDKPLIIPVEMMKK
jgi:hypothetical protein